jgi:uncharacterized protein (TIGR02231 family)
MSRIKFLSIVTFLLLCVSFTYPAQTEINTELKSAKVYLSGAELTHTAKVNLKSGSNEIVFRNFAQYINQQSIRLQAEDGVKILSIVTRTNYLKDQPKPKELVRLQDSLDLLNLKIKELDNRKEILNGEYDIIISNKSIGGSEKGVAVDDLIKFSQFYNKRGSEIKTELSGLEADAKKIKEKINKINLQIQEYNNLMNNPQQEIVASVIAERNMTAGFTIIYYTNNAGWSAEYDVRVNDISKPVEWIYKGNVFQNTGMEWKDIDIVLSNNNPSFGLYLPELTPRYLDFISPRISAGEAMDRLSEVSAQKSAIMVRGVNSMSNMAQTVFVPEQKTTSVEFEAKTKYTIPSDGKNNSILILTYDVPAEFEYTCVPAQLKQALLTAKVKDWAKYNFLPANANVYFENAYVGETYINTAQTDEALSIPVGRDKLINVKRESLKDFTEGKFLSSNVERTYKFETTIVNYRKNEIKLTLKDQIPVSRQEDIEVLNVETEGGKVNTDTGIVEWQFNIKPGETVKKSIGYSVKYPGDRQIEGL